VGDGNVRACATVQQYHIVVDYWLDVSTVQNTFCVWQFGNSEPRHIVLALVGCQTPHQLFEKTLLPQRPAVQYHSRVATGNHFTVGNYFTAAVRHCAGRLLGANVCVNPVVLNN
jgi:hypothetical protein